MPATQQAHLLMSKLISELNTKHQSGANYQ